jgi:aromatic-L-amino-acid decarboxylase
MELGRRFRALKLWFVIRCYGVSGLQKIIRDHVGWTGELADRLAATPGFEITSSPRLGLFSFRIRPENMPASVTDDEALDALNAKLVDAVNGDGTLYLTQTIHDGRYVIRVTIGTTATTAEDIDIAYQKIVELAAPLLTT